MKVLVVGSGAREHALVWKLSSERNVREVIAAPGNPGIARLARCLASDPADPWSLLGLVEREDVDLTVIGPEAPLANGVADLFLGHGRAIVGPTRAAAELESSKAFAKQFMARHAIPTARFRVCGEPGEAFAAADELGFPVVVKADGLAAGKGVVIATDRAEARRAVEAAMIERRFGAAGAQVVIEEHLRGSEASFFVLSDGTETVPLGTAQDHKRAFDGDRGPNTGGMGAFAPSPLVDSTLSERVTREIVAPTIAGMREEAREYRGFLYVGLMLTPEGPHVIEYNVRLGDPEAQVVLPMMAADLLPLLVGVARGRLATSGRLFHPEPRVGVVLASGGYPGSFQSGKPIDGLDEAERMPEVLVFHAGTAMRNGRLVTAGGRVLTVVGSGETYGEAIDRAYAGAARIIFEGKHLRSDIGATARAAQRQALGSRL